jgi:hypothetical protein
MEAKAVSILYLKSLAFILLFIAITISISQIIELIFVDFIHGNPHRTTSNAIEMMFFMTPFVALVSTVAALLILALPQSFEAFLTWKMTRQIGDRGHFSTLVALPLTAVLTWYCYDYLTPSDFNLGINEGADWKPYEHGLTLSRFAAVLTTQTLVTLFNFCYVRTHVRQLPKKIVILPVLGLALVLGCVLGYRAALNQYQFL